MRQEMHPGSVLCGSWNRVKEPSCGMESGGRGRAHVPGLAVTCRANRRLPSRADTTYSPGRRRRDLLPARQCPASPGAPVHFFTTDPERPLPL